ncbi:MAG TPA: hypothetical protein VJA47_00465 [archaeon]|nr:hypothetical protein [archaeon]
MFEAGQFAEAIGNKGVLKGVGLTLSKKYKVLDVERDGGIAFVIIENDNGLRMTYNTRWFRHTE